MPRYNGDNLSDGLFHNVGIGFYEDGSLKEADIDAEGDQVGG